MRRILFLGLLLVVTVLAVSATAAAQTAPDPTTTTAPPPAEGQGTSPWVLVLIGAAGGAVVGGFTGLARRRRAQEGKPR